MVEGQVGHGRRGGRHCATPSPKPSLLWTAQVPLSRSSRPPRPRRAPLPLHVGRAGAARSSPARGEAIRPAFPVGGCRLPAAMDGTGREYGMGSDPPRDVRGGAWAWAAWGAAPSSTLARARRGGGVKRRARDAPRSSTLGGLYATPRAKLWISLPVAVVSFNRSESDVRRARGEARPTPLRPWRGVAAWPRAWLRPLGVDQLN